MNSPVEKIKERLSIDEVISSYINIIKAGNNFKAKCPFHNEKTPSFFISPERGSFYCFGCNKGGDIFTFVEEFEGLDFIGALKVLAEKAHVDLSDFKGEKSEDKDLLYKALEESVLYFENNLFKNKEALDYLKNRGLEENTIKLFRLGFAHDSWRDLTLHLRAKGFSFEIIEKAGLAKRKDEKMNVDSIYDRFRSRIMFPIMDSSGRPVAFSGRYIQLENNKNIQKTSSEVISSKYLNSPETPIFNKSSVLYGLHLAKESIRKNNFSILVEGQMDLLLSFQSGFRNTVAISGTALSDSIYSKENTISNFGLIKRLSNNILFSFDGDRAGISATMRSSSIALSLGMDVKVLSLEDIEDPASFILDNGKDKWKEKIKESKHIIEFLLLKIIADYSSNERKIVLEIKDKVLPFVLLLKSEIEKNYFLKLIHNKTGIDIESLKIDLIKKEEENQKVEEYKKEEINEEINRKENILKKLLGIYYWQDYKKEIDLEKDENFLSLKKIIDNDLFSILENNKEVLIFDTERIINNYDKKYLEKEKKELFLNYKEEYLKEIKKKEEKKLLNKEEEETLVLKTIQDLNNQLEEIEKEKNL